MTPEKWKSVARFEGMYEVSNYGRVRSLPRICRNGIRCKGQVLNPGTNSRGYRRVSLCGNGIPKTTSVHRLVADAFIGSLPDGLQTRHINGDKDDNRVENLTYGTQSENQMDNVRHGKHHQSKKVACINGHPLEGENLALHGGKRKCRECNKVRNRQWRLNHQRSTA